ncbi:MAG TPA: serine/threonine-protein kinase [Polyangiales bacterium]
MAEQRYRVIDRLEAGGMAEVFRGEALSVQGFKKQVAIKRVLPHLAQNKSFIRMFLDEARLGARLNHANIVTVFDIGAADNTYFIVMEFVDGANLKHVLETLKKLNQRPGIKELLYIGLEICKGLSHAHALRDDNGTPLNIVHRDISPPNILITRGGEVKVTDFGLAKATTQLEKTDPGVVKGKFSYLSPEAAMGKEVDARADVFAVGILLWEAMAGRRLFLGESDYETVKRVQRAEVPSLRGVNSEIDEELDKLLMKAMARERESRFQSAQELGDAIADYLFHHRLKVTSYDIARMMTGVVANRDRGKKNADPSMIDKLIQDELLAFTSLDQMDDPLNPASRPVQTATLSKRPLAGARPLDHGSFSEHLENPSEWFAEEDEGQPTAFFDRASMEGPELRSQRSDPQELANLLETDDDPGAATGKVTLPAQDVGALLENELATVSERPAKTSLADLSQRQNSKAGAAPPVPLEPVAAPGAVAAAKPGGGGTTKYVVIALVVLLGAGAALFFGNFIPR